MNIILKIIFIVSLIFSFASCTSMKDKKLAKEEKARKLKLAEDERKSAISWKKVKNSSDPQSYIKFIRKFPNSCY